MEVSAEHRRGGLGEAYRVPTLSSVAASLAPPADVPPCGSGRKCREVAGGKLLVRVAVRDPTLCGGIARPTAAEGLHLQGKRERDTYPKGDGRSA